METATEFSAVEPDYLQKNIDIHRCTLEATGFHITLVEKEINYPLLVGQQTTG